MKAVGALLLLLVPVWVQAGEDLQRAGTLVRQTEYQQALRLAERVLKSPNNGPDDLVEAYRIQGLCLSALGKTEAAVAAFRQLLAIQPGFRLSKDISPKLSPPFYQAAGLAVEQKPVALEHKVPAPGATLEGQDLEVTLLGDPFKMVKAIRLAFWEDGDAEQQLVSGITSPGKLLLKVPVELRSGKVSYFFEAINEFGSCVARAGSKASPFVLQAKAAPRVVVNPPPVVGASSGMTEKKKDDQRAVVTPWYKTWWFWTVVGVAVAGAATGTAVALTSGGGAGGPYTLDIRLK
jgi:tetratricopeptide (TPR) repeat protein